MTKRNGDIVSPCCTLLETWKGLHTCQLMEIKVVRLQYHFVINRRKFRTNCILFNKECKTGFCTLSHTFTKLRLNMKPSGKCVIHQYNTSWVIIMLFINFRTGTNTGSYSSEECGQFIPSSTSRERFMSYLFFLLYVITYLYFRKNLSLRFISLSPRYSLIF